MNTDQRRLETTNLSFIDRCSWALIGSQIAFSAPCHESNPQASQNATEGANASSLRVARFWPGAALRHSFPPKLPDIDRQGVNAWPTRAKVSRIL
jgi:hypothetical protein